MGDNPGAHKVFGVQFVVNVLVLNGERTSEHMLLEQIVHQKP